MFVSFFLFLRCGNFRLSWVVNVPDFRHYRYLGQALLKVCACFGVSTYSHIHGCNQFCHPEQKQQRLSALGLCSFQSPLCWGTANAAI